MVQGSMSCIKYLMFLFNLIFVICGLALIIVGAYMTKRDMTVFLENKYATVSVLLIVVGCVIFLVAFLGCCGAVKENHCMVMMFGILVFVIFVVEIGGGIAAYMYRGEVDNFLKENMNTTLAQQKEDAVRAWDDMQKGWQCCGVVNVTDYVYNNVKIPDTCCSDEIRPCTEDKAWNKGCYPQMLEKIKSAIGIVGGVAIGLGVVELLGCMFAWCLASAIKRDYEGV